VIAGSSSKAIATFLANQPKVKLRFVRERMREVQLAKKRDNLEQLSYIDHIFCRKNQPLTAASLKGVESIERSSQQGNCCFDCRECCTSCSKDFDSNQTFKLF
jgi:hypothetical protein